MAQSDMVIFDEFFQPAIYETLSQMVNQFNAASSGAIQLVTAANIGDYLSNSFYDALQSTRRRVDRYAANAAVATTQLTQTEHVAVKVAGGFGPIGYEPAQMTWLRKPTAEAIEIISRQFAEAVLQDQLNTAILAAVTAIENQADATNSVAGAGVITQSVINGSHAKFGDMSQMIVADVMTGSMFHKLIGQALLNAEQLFVSSNVRVVNILGKTFVITDAPALLATVPTPDQDKVLSLVSGGVVIRDPADPITNIETNNGTERITTTVQMDYDFTVDLKGYAWDKTSGGASPTDADLGTGANWDRDVSNVKQTAGTIAIGDIV